jgi:molybdopterin-guanine dinucleotide biosynthesis protein A
MISNQDITGLILAGGRGSRMGGVDKGLQNHRGLPLAMHALMRLQPQVGAIVINANRNLGAYEAMGAPVYPDSTQDFAGPLAGVLVGLEQCQTPWLVTVPCDSPDFPLDLVEQLARTAAAQDADVAYAVTTEADGREQTHPVFCLLKNELMESLVAFMQGGGRKIDAWFAQHKAVGVHFADARAFFNANTAQELAQLQR